MGEITGIAWTDHTFNPWWGCEKISPGCANCYAEAWAKRAGADVWGLGKPRRTFGEKHWLEPRKWNLEAERERRRHRVFCASMADVFEEGAPGSEQARLFALIEETLYLDWQLLTKRPERVLEVAPRKWLKQFPANVWVGTSVEDQARADERIPQLIAIPAVVRFLSAEPLLGPVDLTRVSRRLPDITPVSPGSGGVVVGSVLGDTDGREFSPRGAAGRGIDWVIVGGESGPKARPCGIAWIRSVVHQCRAAGVACFVKQLGAKPGFQGSILEALPGPDTDGMIHDPATDWLWWEVRDRKGGDPSEWPVDLRVRQFPKVVL